MSIKQRLFNNQAGDTIVEVLIVVMVIGAVLTSGYTIATASLNSIQLTQERTYALKLAQNQLEELKAAAASNPSAILNQGFCLDTALKSYAISGGSPTATMPDTYSNYPSQCKQAPVGGSCASYCFQVGIINKGSNEYQASVRWDGAGGNTQQVELSYRVYQ